MCAHRSLLKSLWSWTIYLLFVAASVAVIAWLHCAINWQNIENISFSCWRCSLRHRSMQLCSSLQRSWGNAIWRSNLLWIDNCCRRPVPRTRTSSRTLSETAGTCPPCLAGSSLPSHWSAIPSSLSQCWPSWGSHLPVSLAPHFVSDCPPTLTVCAGCLPPAPECPPLFSAGCLSPVWLSPLWLQEVMAGSCRVTDWPGWDCQH